MAINAFELGCTVPAVSSERRLVRLLDRPELDVPVTRVAIPPKRESQLGQAWVLCKVLKREITASHVAEMLEVDERRASRLLSIFGQIGLIRAVRREAKWDESRGAGPPRKVWELVV